MTAFELAAHITRLYTSSVAIIRSWTVAEDYLPLLKHIFTQEDIPSPKIHLDNYPEAVSILFERPVYTEETPNIVVSIHVDGGIAFIDHLNRFQVVWTN